ncbi:hypothetical protein N7451_001197 [Penicillium sp. IBT 35674x]|nr:hypothetical protein N7451_001197 [Penicillium sp. IBT 35674x]
MVNTRRSVQYAAAARVTVTTAHSPITPQSSSHSSPPKRIHLNKATNRWSATNLKSGPVQPLCDEL